MNEGLTLDKYLKKKLRLEPSRAVKVTLQVARQLEAEPSSQIVYPGRILILKDGRVKLLPSGDSRDKRPAALLHPAYASPEEIRGGKRDVRAALYSLGCTLYELVAGAPPYDGEDGKEVLRAHLKSPIPDVREASTEASSRVAAIVRELLAKTPEERIQTPGELIARLQQTGSRTGATKRAPRAPARRGQSPPRKTKRPPRAAREVTAEPLEDVTPGKKSYPLTIAGGVLGLLIGVLVLILQLKSMEKEKKTASDRVATRMRTEHMEALGNRKKAALGAEAAQGTEIKKFLLENRKADPELRQASLILALDGRFTNSSYRHVLVDEIVKIWSTPGLGEDAKSAHAKRDQAFEQQKLAAEALHASGKLGKAIAKLMENHHEFKVRHAKEIDARVVRWSDELTEKWTATKAKVDRMFLAGKGEKAVELLLEANEYGDEPIFRQTTVLLRHARAMATSEPETEEKPDDDVARLEKEFGKEFDDEEGDDEDEDDELDEEDEG